MRALKGIDIAFLPMNLPYTMTVQKAQTLSGSSSQDRLSVSYRSGDGKKADLEELKQLVGQDSGVEIRSRDWYSERYGQEFRVEREYI